MFATPVNLFNSWDLATQGHNPKIQEIVLYCASRLRAIVQSATQAPDRSWVLRGLIVELVSSNPVILNITFIPCDLAASNSPCLTSVWPRPWVTWWTFQS